ncbi:MAG: hypothetical protein AAB395_00905 [Patescibacteria group bacterium]
MLSRKDVSNEAVIGITICAFLGTVALFFTGLLIAQLAAFNPNIKVGILFLIVATFGLIFSAIVYANAAGEINTKKVDSEHEFIAIGNSISEFLGIYPFIIAIPLVINAITDDPFLRTSTFIITLLSIVAYTFSRFSIVARASSQKSTRILVGIIMGVFLTLLNFGQNTQGFFETTSVIFLVILTYLAYRFRYNT